MSSLACPRCQSQDVKKFSVLYKQGVADTTTVTTAGGTVGGEYVVGTSSSSGVSVTRMARETSPPANRNTATPFVMAIISGLGLFSTFGTPGNWRIIWLVILLISAPLYLTRKRYNVNVVPGLREKWDRSFRCLRCDASFESNF